MFNMAYHLATERHHVVIFCMSRGAQPGWSPLEDFTSVELITHDFPSEKTSLLHTMKALHKLSKRIEFDYTFSTHTHVNAMLSFLRKTGILRTRRLVSRESTVIFERFRGLKRALLKALYRFFYGAQDLLICQTNAMKESLLRNLGYAPVKKIVFLANPVNNIFLQNMTRAYEVDIPAQITLLVACGRLIPIKGFNLLIEAISRLSRKNIKLIILGEGPELKNLQRLSKESNCHEVIEFRGRVENPYPFFARADIGIISSLKEGFPNVLIEMMAAGTKQIVTTPCTDGLDSIPGLHLASEATAEGLITQLELAMENKSDRSEIYKSYIAERRSAAAFWEKIVQESCY